MKPVIPIRNPASREDVASAHAEGRRFGWLRSRFMRAPWPREGVSSCGRQGCAVCDQKKDLAHDN
jgi:hypothetical protein